MKIIDTPFAGGPGVRERVLQWLARRHIARRYARSALERGRPPQGGSL